MAHIAGVDLPNNKRVEISLTYLYGIGRSLAKEIVESAISIHKSAWVIFLMRIFQK